MIDPAPATETAVLESRWGDLGLLTFPSLIHNICDERITGILRVMDSEVAKSIYVDRGRVVFATSDLPEDSLGGLLIRRGTIPLRELSAATRVSEETGRGLGGILVERQILRPQDLIWAVREQVKEIVVGLFDWTRGQYRFDCGPYPEDAVITLRMSTGDIVLEGVRRIDCWERIQLAVGSSRTRYQSTPRLEEIARTMNLSLEEWMLLSRCEAPVSLVELCDGSSLKDIDICRLVWTFTIVGVLTRLEG
jgi:hypothetical protein